MIFSTQTLGLFLNALLVLGPQVATASAQGGNELHGLQYVYAQEHLDLYDLERISPVEKRRQLQDATTTEMRSLHIACSEYKQATENEKFLKIQVGANNVYPAYVSESSNAVCFALFVTPSIASAIQEIPSVQSVVQVPTELKIHQLILNSFGLISGHKPKGGSTFSKKPKLQEFLLAKLVLSGGIGVHNNIVPSEDFVTANDLGSLLSSATLDPTTFLEALSGSSETSGDRPKAEFWTKALSQLKKAYSSGSTCPFSALEVEASPSGTVVVGGLDQFFESISEEMTTSCGAALIALLVQQKGVSDLRYRLPKAPFNEHGKSIVQTESFTTSFPYTNAGIDGTGQVVGIGDTGVDELSCFFRNTDSSKVARSTYKNPTYDNTKRKVIQYISYCDDTDTKGGHGTHVSGTVAGQLIGTDTTFESDNGHGSGAKIAFFDMEYSNKPETGIHYPDPFDKYVLTPAYDAGARLHSNSWGSGYNYYDDSVLSIDSFSVTNTDFLALFAASNDGSDGYYSIGSPAVSKNALTVGATKSSSASDINKVAYFSSIGPTFDNRIKPDVVAPGYFTISAMASGSTTEETCKVTSMAGTSMATPATAGAAAQIRSYFARGMSANCRYNLNSDCSALTNPRGATVKALLIQSGEPITSYDATGVDTEEPTATLGATPDMYQGFGRISLKNILPYTGIEENLKIVITESSISASNRLTYTVTVSASTLPLKATLVWMDPANSVISSTKMLLNDLDLQIKYVTGNQMYYGNGILRDEYNNVEQVTIATPLTGTYEISVSAAAYLTTTSQSFSLIIGSAGLTFSSSVTTFYTTCGTNQELVYMTAMDHDGDGWGTGNSYLVQKNGVTIATGTMSGSVGDDSYKQMSMCLDHGTDYSVSLIQTGDDEDEMGFEIDHQVYLSNYKTSGTFSVPATSCANPSLDLVLVGSLYGVPYGWNGDTHYQLTQTSGGSLSYKGTLVTGLTREHSYCLPDGSYEVTMHDVPKTDDFFDDDYMGGYFGAEEYLMEISLSTVETAINEKYKFTFTLKDGVVTSANVKKTGGGSDDDDGEVTPGAAAAIAFAVIFVVVAVICCGVCYWNNKKKATGALANQDSVEIHAK